MNERDKAEARDRAARARLLADPILEIIARRDDLERKAPQHHAREATEELTPYEIQVLRYFSQGLEYKMVADAMNRSINTVMTQMKSARKKLRAKNTTHACCEAIRRGLIP